LDTESERFGFRLPWPNWWEPHFVVIAHRNVPTIQHADLICVMEAGKNRGQGTGVHSGWWPTTEFTASEQRMQGVEA
jgi:hypothetical protein